MSDARKAPKRVKVRYYQSLIEAQTGGYNEEKNSIDINGLHDRKCVAGRVF